MEWDNSLRKTAFDKTSVVIALPFLVSLVAALAILVVCIDRAVPIFYQWRVGKGGKPFKFFKLNTMGRMRFDDCSRGANDPRATWLGKVLRWLILDETPQILINVLNGTMSLVGPRPLLQGDIDLMRQRLSKAEYEEWFAAYCGGLPGWTGRFGVASRKYEIQSDQYLKARHRCDIAYRHEATWWIDIKTILVHAVLPLIALRRRLGIAKSIK
jgi:lipopolysaccharide/colanic/teichoic acid biosynthesis glycosyltransferase